MLRSRHACKVLRADKVVDDSRVQCIQVKVGQATSVVIGGKDAVEEEVGVFAVKKIGRPALQVDINRTNEKGQLSSILKHFSISE